MKAKIRIGSTQIKMLGRVISSDAENQISIIERIYTNCPTPDPPKTFVAEWRNVNNRFPKCLALGEYVSFSGGARAIDVVPEELAKTVQWRHQRHAAYLEHKVQQNHEAKKLARKAKRAEQALKKARIAEITAVVDSTKAELVFAELQDRAQRRRGEGT